MAIIEVVTAQMRAWQASPDPTLPEGAWIASGTVVGTATGGPRTIQIDFQKAATRLSSRLFSLEQMALTDVSSAVIQWELQTFNLETFEGQGIASRAWALNITKDNRPNGNGGALDTFSNLLPLFLGAPSQAGVAAGISFVADNVNAITMVCFAQGFFWGPRSITAPGGPQRPLRSIYGG